MYLSKLEIFGFKSFANKTVINFTKGITGIVGPNGCGKTNIVDAIRWCLGEQKSSTLRSDKMENVIFNGTRSRKPMGMSEVSLTLVNDNNALPSEYTEITITRRIFRSGESEYLLNKNICRLKDITNLFMDTGMGTNAYSVIELKMIETILSNKADERRKMFEEAAGVNKYKLRRKHTLKKLEDVKSDLTRVNDIVAEVEKNVRSLERQAKRADKYNKVQAILKEKELDLAERQFSRYSIDIAILNDGKEKYNNRKQEIDAEIKQIERELIVYKEKITDIEHRLRLKQNEISASTEKLHDVQNKISVSEERKKSLKSNLDRYKQELDEFIVQKSETEEMIVESNENIQDYLESIAKKEVQVEELTEATELKRETFEKHRLLLKERNDAELKKYKDLTQKENHYSNLVKAAEKSKKGIELLNRKITDTTSHIAKSVGFLEELGNEKEALEKRLTESEAQYSKKQKEKDELEKVLSGLKENELEEKSNLNGLKDKINFLQSLITNLEGVSKAAKTLIESEGWTDKPKTLLADVGNSKQEYKFALEASLKYFLNNLLIESTQDLLIAVNYIKKNDLGKATFYLLRDGGENGGVIEFFKGFRKKRKNRQLEKSEGFINWAYNLVDAGKKWVPYFEQALANVAVVKDIESALKIGSEFPDYTFTTVDGDIVFSNGVVEAGSLPKLDETLFGRKQMLEELKNDYPKLEANLVKVRREIEQKEETIAAIDLKELSEQGKIIVNDKNNVEKQISQFEYEIEKDNQQIDSVRNDIQQLVNEANSIEDEIAELAVTIETVKAEKEKSEQEIADIENQLKQSESEYNEVVSALNQRKVELERLKGQQVNIQNNIERAEKSLVTITNGIEKRTLEIERNEEELVTLGYMLEEKQVEYEEIHSARTKLVTEETGIDQEHREIKREAAKVESGISLQRDEKQEISEGLHKIDLQLNEKQFRINSLFENIREEYNIDLELKEFDDLDTFNFEETSKEVHKYKEQLKNLGPINLLAYSEYEEEKERFDFLQKQRDDLVVSEKDLVKTIGEINQTAQDLFVDTFTEIRQNFQQIFRTLFDPGDEADLLIDEGVDPLDAKIEITAKPKGKRPTSIELLSGGEKTLTATALLFAIYLVKPSPFCILDEVDAPLDDANVDRFTNLLKEFSNNTQFIIVTHNKRTMEAGENMYGVTMQEEGISKLAAVQFNEDLPV